jgi:hypothetical protein
MLDLRRRAAGQANASVAKPEAAARTPTRPMALGVKYQGGDNGMAPLKEPSRAAGGRRAGGCKAAS